MAGNEQFVSLANDMVKHLATGPGAATPEELLGQTVARAKGRARPAVGRPLNRIREAFNLERIVPDRRPCGRVWRSQRGRRRPLGGRRGQCRTGSRDICMHIAAMRPLVLRKEDLDPALVAKERDLIDQVVTKEAVAVKEEAERILALPDQKIQDPTTWSGPSAATCVPRAI